jgi:hypothetical protein
LDNHLLGLRLPRPWQIGGTLFFRTQVSLSLKCYLNVIINMCLDEPLISGSLL